jgi:hypothetical protein
MVSNANISIINSDPYDFAPGFAILENTCFWHGMRVSRHFEINATTPFPNLKTKTSPKVFPIPQNWPIRRVGKATLPF